MQVALYWIEPKGKVTIFTKIPNCADRHQLAIHWLYLITYITTWWNDVKQFYWTNIKIHSDDYTHKEDKRIYILYLLDNFKKANRKVP